MHEQLGVWAGLGSVRISLFLVGVGLRALGQLAVAAFVRAFAQLGVCAGLGSIRFGILDVGA